LGPRTCEPVSARRQHVRAVTGIGPALAVAAILAPR
jgi:hypothetical protein